MRNFVRVTLALVLMVIVAMGTILYTMANLEIERDGEQINIRAYGHVWVYKLDWNEK